MRTLSKSKLIAFRQCPKRLWLEVHQPELRSDSAGTQASFAVGHSVGSIARKLYDTTGAGVELDLGVIGMPSLLNQTRELLTGRQPIFEAGFSVTIGTEQAALALADVLLPDAHGNATSWRMVEVKSSTKVKDYHRDDAAIQHYVATQAGVPLSAIAVAHIDSSWTYPGDDNYQGLLVEVDLTEEASSRADEVNEWIRQAHEVAARAEPPSVDTSDHCGDPFECGFMTHCREQNEALRGAVQYPVHWLPRVQAKALKAHVASRDVRSLSDVPDDLLNATQQRVKAHTLRNEIYFDAAGAAADIAAHSLPALFLDFETINYAVPRWAGTRPYQQIPFQFSVHRLMADGSLQHAGFLDLSGSDPRPAFADALLRCAQGTGPIFVYNRGFEGARLRELAAQLPHLAAGLHAIDARLVDLLPIAQARYYHPSQQGSWSIKAVLPAIAPELRYGDLAGVQDGGGAQVAFGEASDPATSPDRRLELRDQLWRYCRLDTFAMIRVWAHFAGSSHSINPVDDAPSIDAARQ
ncbi:MAG: DUF2779 domain-containing protein [Pseudomonadota bacterium]